MKNVNHFGEHRAGLLCYVVGMVVVLTIYQVLITVSAQLDLFSSIDRYQKIIQTLSISLLILMLGLLWMAYRQWQSIIREHDQLETILESIGPDVIIAIDRNNRILRSGGAVEQMSGYKPEDLIGQKTDLLYHERESGGQSYQIQSAIQKAGFHLGYATGRTKAGNEYLLEIQTSGLRSLNGGAVLILHNLDERQHAHAQLRRRVKIEETFADISTTFLRATPESFDTSYLTALEKTSKIFDHESASVGFFDTHDRIPRKFWVWPQNSKFSDTAFFDALTKASADIKKGDKIAYKFPQDLKNAPESLIELHKKWNLHSLVLSPMRFQGQDFGFLALFSKKRSHRWVQEDNVSLRALTNTFLTGELSMRTAELLPKPAAAVPVVDDVNPIPEN